MALRGPVSIRFDVQTKERLLAVSEASGLTPTELVRRATMDYLSRVAVEQKITIPVVMEDRAPYGCRNSKRK